MEWNLKELGSTLVVGAAVVALVCILLRSFFNTFRLLALRRIARRSDLAFGGIVLLLMFFTGVVVEGLTERLRDDAVKQIQPDSDEADRSHWIPVAALPSCVRFSWLHDEDTARLVSLVRDLDEPRPSPLTLQLDAADLLFPDGEDRRRDSAQVRDSRAWVAAHRERGGSADASPSVWLQHEDTRRPTLKHGFDYAARDLYYRAKNVVYRHDNYFAELREIQSRVDFMRSVHMSALCGLWLCVGLCLVKLAFPRLVSAPPLEVVAESGEGERNAAAQVRASSGALRMLVLSRGLNLILALALVGLLTMIGHGHEEDEFNKRTYGYYLTLVEQPLDE